VFENRVLRRIFVLKRYEIVGGWKNCIMRSFIGSTADQLFLECTHRGEVHTDFDTKTRRIKLLGNSRRRW
jgi:hypothetical protein